MRCTLETVQQRWGWVVCIRRLTGSDVWAGIGCLTIVEWGVCGLCGCVCVGCDGREKTYEGRERERKGEAFEIHREYMPEP